MSATTPIHQMQKATLIAGLQLNPGDPNLLQELATRLEAEESWQELYDQFLVQLGSLEADSPLDGFVRYMIGKAAMGLGRFDEAVVWLQKAALIRPDFPYVHHHLARCYRHLQRYQEALEASQNCCSLIPHFPWSWLEAGEVQLLLGQPHEALRSLQQALQAQRRQDPAALQLFEQAFTRAQEGADLMDRQMIAAQLWPDRPPLNPGESLEPLEELELSLHQFRTILNRVESRRDAGPSSPRQDTPAHGDDHP